MTLEIPNRADNNDDDIGRLVRDLTDVIEREVRAFQSLFEALREQQELIIRGDVQSISQSNEEVEAIVLETRKLERERCGKSNDISRCLDMEEELTLSQIIPHVEQHYADRLEKLRNVLEVLSQKIKNTNDRNRYLLDHSLQFVDKCLRVLVGGREGDVAYDRMGTVEVRDTSLYKGIG